MVPKPYLIDMQKAMAALEKYKQSAAYLAKIEDVRQAYFRDKVRIEPFTSTKK